MNVAYFDCVGGASGDMLLGALVDAGAAEAALRAAVEALRLTDCSLSFERVMKGPLSATQANVVTPRREAHRHVTDLLAIIDSADLPASLKAQAAAILRRLAEVEAGIHHAPLESVHLHELGGDDTLIDIVGVLAGLADLKIDEATASPLPLALGWTKSAHGPLPLPAPATLALLTGVPVRPMDVEAELVTPTGAALLTSIARRFGVFPPMTLRRIGYGAGRRDMPFPNVIRLWLGETPSPATAAYTWEQLVLIETNIDDMNPQIYGYTLERLLSAGALDVTLTPLQMKKNRPGTLLSVLARPEHSEPLTQILFEETTSLGVRRQTVERVSVGRTLETVETPYGPVRVKVARWPGGSRCMPEYEDCRLAAQTHHVPLALVMAAAREKANNS
jgi:pyridinium-3,5-bisthiocarboxylic acid mononucleotide nickel chelatase